MSRVLEVWSGDPMPGVSEEDARTRLGEIKKLILSMGAKDAQLMRFSDACGAEIPRWIRLRLQNFGDDTASIKAFGLVFDVGIVIDPSPRLVVCPVGRQGHRDVYGDAKREQQARYRLVWRR